MFTLFSSHRYETTTTGEKELTFPHAFDFHSLISHRIDFSVVVTDKENQFLIPSMMMSTCCWCSCVSRTAALVSRARFPPFSCHMLFRSAEKKTVSQAAQQRARRHDMWNCADKINCLHFLQNHQEKCCLPFGFHLTHSSCSLSWINFPAHLRLFLTFSLFSSFFCWDHEKLFNNLFLHSSANRDARWGSKWLRLSRNLSWAGPPEHRQRLDRRAFQ